MSDDQSKPPQPEHVHVYSEEIKDPQTGEVLMRRCACGATV